MISVTELANGRGVLCYASGEASLEELYREKSSVPARFPNLPEWLFAIVDLLDVLRLQGDFHGIERLAEQDRRAFSGFRDGIVLVIIADGAAFGIARMWEGVNVMTAWNSKVFRDRASAETWIQQEVLKTFGVELPALQLGAAKGEASG